MGSSKSSPLYVATESFYVHGNELVMKGHTVAAGHPLLRGRMNLFQPFEPTHGELESGSGASAGQVKQAVADAIAKLTAEHDAASDALSGQLAAALAEIESLTGQLAEAKADAGTPPEPTEPEATT